jgi:hypothetical protein
MRAPKKINFTRGSCFHSFLTKRNVNSAEEVCDCGDDDLLLLEGELGKDW